MKYPAIITRDKHGKYLVEFPRLVGCITGGDTFDEAIANAKEALGGWLEARYEHVLDIPDIPTAVPRTKKKGTKVEYIEVEPVLALAIAARQARLKKGLSLKKAASALNISYQNYAKVLENPKGNPTIKSIDTMLKSLGYKIDIKIIPLQGKSKKVAS